ncbi:hypothetical protein [Sedimentisphaera salicampi]|uniref:hypothetical protein n=1 Tax=Sedimentisphaera salicampi TaxID=1941349 RepID=UPI000B9B6DCF|nr:hypothetical protein [Sedimentisphaera salicampi]OXU15402.1 hypothetical protein SMSP1_00883 [Sedimentisphaera salicampi]
MDKQKKSPCRQAEARKRVKSAYIIHFTNEDRNKISTLEIWADFLKQAKIPEQTAKPVQGVSAMQDLTPSVLRNIIERGDNEQ